MLDLSNLLDMTGSILDIIKGVELRATKNTEEEQGQGIRLWTAHDLQ